MCDHCEELNNGVEISAGEEMRYYLNIVLEQIEAEEAAATDTALEEGKPMLRRPCQVQYIVTAVQLPTGAIELAVNDKFIKEKIEYILEAYNDEMQLKTNTAISMKNIMIV